MAVVHCLLFCVFILEYGTSLSATARTRGRGVLCGAEESRLRPVAWTIAASDSGGGAGIEADIRTYASLGVHGCTVMTGLTAQSSLGVEAILPTSTEHISQTLAVLLPDLRPSAIKIGALCTSQVARVVAEFFQRNNDLCPVVLDPIVLSTSGQRLLDDEGIDILRNELLPRATVVTPNARELEFLLDLDAGDLRCVHDLKSAAKQFATKYKTAVLAKGGHLTREKNDNAVDVFVSHDVTHVLALSEALDTPPEVHGTGCVLSSAMAGALARGESALDAVVVAKALCAQAMAAAENPKLGCQGPPPAAVPSVWPDLASIYTSHTFPEVVTTNDQLHFARCEDNLQLLALADTAARANQLFQAGVNDVQLRLKQHSEEEVRNELSKIIVPDESKRLWLNDYWRIAVEAKSQSKLYGVHLGQEDLDLLETSDLLAIAHSGLRLGLSTHSPAELARAIGLKPSYIAIGPVFGTTSKDIAFQARGLRFVSAWRSFIPRDIPLVAIGSIDLQNGASVLDAGADSLAVISALPRDSEDLAVTLPHWLTSMPWGN